MKLKKKSAKFYDFYRDGITQSMIAKWLQCPKQAKLEYVDGWTPYERSDAIMFGNAVHHVLENVYQSDTTPLAGNIRSHMIGFEQALYGKDEPSLVVQQKNEFIFTQAETLLQAYLLKYNDDWTNNWIFTEKTFRVPYTYPDGKTTVLRGKIDGAFVKKNAITGKNELWFIDHKTSSRPDIENTVSLLPVDLQVWFYLYVCTQLPEFKGKKISGFCYNMIRRPGSKQTQKENLSEYSTRLYTDIVGRLDFYFHRENLQIKNSEIRDWKTNQLDPIMRDVRRWVDSKYHWPSYFSPTALKTVYGLAPMAKAIASSNFDNLYQRETPFQELT